MVQKFIMKIYSYKIQSYYYEMENFNPNWFIKP